MSVLFRLELAVCLGGVWPLVRLAALTPFRRKLRAFPRQAALFILLLVAWAPIVLGVALVLPDGLHALALAIAGGWLLILWRARPGWGRRRGLPPGSLLPAPAGPWLDPDYYRKRFDRHGPIFKHMNVVQPGLCVGDMALADRLLRAATSRLGPARPVPFDRLVPGGLLRYQPPERHASCRPRLLRALPPSVVGRCEADLTAILRTELGPLAAGPEIAALPALLRLVHHLMDRLFFGITPHDPEVAPLEAALQELDIRRPPWRLATARRAAERAVRQVEALASVPRITSRPGFLASLAAAGPLDRSLLFQLVVITRMTAYDLAGLFVWVLKMLSEHPQRVAELRAATECPGAGVPDPAERVVLETLRLEQSEFVVRTVTETFTFEGWTLPRGWHLRICKREAHRAAPGVPEPGRFDPDRFLGPALSRHQFAPFGPPESACPGETITRRLGALFVRELTSAYDWTLSGAERPAFDGLHWTPGRRLRLRLRARGGG